MSISFFKQKTIENLYSQIEKNLGRYREGDFDDLITDEDCYHSDVLTFDHDILATIQGSSNEDADNSLKIYKALDGLTPYLARDERIWCHLTHTHLFKYAQERWPIPDDDEKTADYIGRHFFAKSDRSFERENAASRLWWAAYVCSRVPNIELERALEVLFYRLDITNILIEQSPNRTGTAAKRNFFPILMNKLNASYDTDEKLLFNREKFREYLHEVDLLGGHKLIEGLTISKLSEALKPIDAKVLSEELAIEELDTIVADEADVEDAALAGEEETAAGAEVDRILAPEELRNLLLKLDREVIHKKFPHTEVTAKLLSPAMLGSLLYSKPRNIEEFTAMIPMQVRELISGEESEFLDDVLKIIEENT